MLQTWYSILWISHSVTDLLQIFNVDFTTVNVVGVKFTVNPQQNMHYMQRDPWQKVPATVDLAFIGFYICFLACGFHLLKSCLVKMLKIYILWL